LKAFASSIGFSVSLWIFSISESSNACLSPTSTI
jgi:hypothetical protein